MRKVLISLAAAAATLAVAAPASAQAWGNITPGYGSGAPAYGYGYGNHYGNPASFQAEIQQVRNQYVSLLRQGRLTRAESRDLSRDIQRAERRLAHSSRYGLSPQETYEIRKIVIGLHTEVRRYADYDGRRMYRRY